MTVRLIATSLTRELAWRVLSAMSAMSFSLALAVLLTGLGSARAADDDPSVAAAKAHYAEGLVHASQGNYENALQSFRDAHAASPHYAVLYNIAQALVALHRPVAAAEMLSQYLWEGKDRIPPERRVQVEEQLRDLGAFLGEVEVFTDPPGALISVDSQPVGRTPLSHPILLSAGLHTIVASAEGRQTVDRSIGIRDGRRYEVVLPLPALAAKSGPNKQTPVGIVAAPPEPKPSHGRMRTALPYALIGTGVVLGVAAFAFYLGRKETYEQWQANNNSLQKESRGTRLYEVLSDQNKSLGASLAGANRTIIGLSVTGGLLVTVGTSLHLLDRMTAARSATLTVAWSGGSSVAARWEGSW